MFAVDLSFRVNLSKNPNARAKFDGLSISRLFIVADSNLSFTNVDFVRARRTFLVQNSTVSFTNCRFLDNNVLASGGAVWAVTNCALRFSNCTFQNNTAETAGGAIAATDFTLIDVSDSNFVNNVASSAGAISLAITTNNITLKQSNIVGCTFTNNVATDMPAFGGAIVLQNVRGSATSVTRLSRCKFRGNSGVLGGAALFDSSNSIITDCSFVNNTATNEGGALRIRGSSKVDF